MSLWDTVAGWFSSNGSDNKAAASAFDNGQVKANAMAFGNVRSAAVRQYNTDHPYQGFLNPVGQAAGAVASAVGSPINDYVIKPLGWTINEADRGLATATLYTDANDTSGGTGLADWVGFNSKAWKMAWDASKHTNVGQAVLWQTDIKNDPSNQGASFFSSQGQATYQKQIMDSWAGRIVSGGIDVAATWYADPTILVGKGVKIAHAASEIKDGAQAEDVFNAASRINSGETADRAATPLRVVSKDGQGLFSKGAEEAGWREFQLVKSWDNGGNQAGRQVLLARTPETAPVLSLLDMADKIPEIDKQRQAKLAILGASRDSASARQWLTDNVPDLARAHERAMLAPEDRPALDALNDALTGRKFGSYGFQAAAQTWVTAAESYGTVENRAEIAAMHTRALKGIHDQFDRLDEMATSMPLETAGATALDRLKAGLRNHVAQDFHYQDAMSGRTVRVLHWATNQRFRGTIATDHAIRGNQELMDWMTRAKVVHPETGQKVPLFSGEERQVQSQQFLTATTQEQRRRQVDSLWDNMYTKIAALHGDMDVDAVKEAVNHDRLLRQGAVQYTTRELEKARLAGDDFVTLEDPSGTPTRLRAALLSTHIANNVHLPDPEEVTRRVRQAADGPSAIDAVSQRAHSFVNGLDTYNNLWRVAVLGRPGILIRTQLDSQARALAVMRGTAYVHSAMEGLGHWVGKKLSPEEWTQVDARASDLQEAQRLEDEAERLHSTADVRARITKQRQGRVEKAVTTPTLQSRAYILQGLEKDTTLPLDADAIANMSTPALRARAEANLAAAAELKARKYDTLKFQQGTLDETLDLGKGRSMSTRLATSGQDARDLRSAAYKGGRPSEALLVRNMGGRDALNNAHSREMRRLFEDRGKYKTYDPEDRYWAAGWIRTWDTLRNSHTVERILNLPEVGTRDLIRSLREDPMVRKEWEEIRGDNPDFNAWLAHVANKVAWLAPTHELRSALVSKGHMPVHEVEDMFAKVGDTESPLPQRMHVEGPYFTKQLPEGIKHRDFVGAFFRKLMDEPDLKGARHPVMVERYRKHVTELATRELDRTGEMALTPAAQAKIERIAKHRAIQDTQQTFYDTAKFTGAHNSLRFASPFLGAWQDAMESWARLFYDDPNRAGAFYKIWNVPNRLGLVVDQNGDMVRPGQQADQSYLVLPLQFGKSFKDTKKLTFRKDSLNSIFQGAQWYTPGTGPLIQVPMQEIVARTFPELGDMNNPLTKTLLPFGTPKTGNPLGDFAQASLPAYVKAFMSMTNAKDPNNARAYLASVNEQIINARKAGKPIPTAAQLDAHARAAARTAGFVRGITLWGLGVSGDQTGPVDFYKRKYDQLQSQAAQLHAAGTTPSEEFVRQFPEAAGLKWSISQTKTGVNATVKAFQAERDYKKQIAANPEFGWFYVGADNLTGDFSQSIYNAQSSRDIGLGGEGNERQMLTRRQLIDATLAEDGWKKYGAVQAMVSQQLKAQGLTSINQKAAEAIKAAKNELVGQLRQSNPAWAADYDSPTANKLQQFLDNIATPALSDPALKSRADIKALGAYIQMRTTAVNFLKSRGLTLAAKDAAPIAAALDQAGSALADSNLGFEQMWTRVLGREVETNNDNTAQEGAA